MGFLVYEEIKYMTISSSTAGGEWNYTTAIRLTGVTLICSVTS